DSAGSSMASNVSFAPRRRNFNASETSRSVRCKASRSSKGSSASTRARAISVCAPRRTRARNELNSRIEKACGFTSADYADYAEKTKQRGAVFSSSPLQSLFVNPRNLRNLWMALAPLLALCFRRIFVNFQFTEKGNHSMGTVPITVAHGDGIGPEIMDATLFILKEAGAKLDIQKIDIGEKVYLAGNSSGIEPSSWDSLRSTRVFLKAPITTPQGGGFKSLNVTVR